MPREADQRLADEGKRDQDRGRGDRGTDRGLAPRHRSEAGGEHHEHRRQADRIDGDEEGDQRMEEIVHGTIVP